LIRAFSAVALRREQARDPVQMGGLKLYYSFKVNDNFTVPLYLDFINDAGSPLRPGLPRLS